MQSRGGRNLRVNPVFVCDTCMLPIASVRDGVAIHRNLGVGEDELLELKHAHKGVCQDRIETMLGDEDAPLWDELAVHIMDLAGNSKLTISDMIMRIQVQSCLLDPDQQTELRDQISDLVNWLCNRGVHSSLWCEECPKDPNNDEVSDK
jgi:hypothetical protein